MAAEVALLGLWAWDVYEKEIKAIYDAKYKPFPVLDKPKFTAGDVSIIVPTIDTDDEFQRALQLWLANNPREIIIVTIPRDLSHVQKLVAGVARTGDKIKILTIDKPNKRRQINRGLQEATGKIICLADDDAFWNTETIMPHLLAPFEDDRIGGVSGLQSADVAKHRRDPTTITPWEVAGVRTMYNQNEIQAVRYAVDRGVWCLMGRTMFFRAEILQTEEFKWAFVNERWGSNVLNTGDDQFITTYLLMHGWESCIQNVKEAEITTHIMIDDKLLQQLVRWQRNSHQTFYRLLFIEPGFGLLWKKHPFMARKIVERLLRPIYTFVYLFTWIWAMCETPIFGILFLLWFICGWVENYGKFVQKHPYCTRKVWAAFLMDYTPAFVDVFAWVTVNTESWMTRDDTLEAVDIKEA